MYDQRKINSTVFPGFSILGKRSLNLGSKIWIELCLDFAKYREPKNDFPPNSILGMDALEHETVWNVMYRRSLDFARRGTFMAGLSAIDIALWDIKVSTVYIISLEYTVNSLKLVFSKRSP